MDKVTFKKLVTLSNLLLLSGLVFTNHVTAEDPKEESKNNVLRRITVADTKEQAAKTPGSVNVLAGEELDNKLQGVGDIHRVLRQIPGVNIQEEEGYGLRPNIGLRGTSVERSDKITLMEDGILIAPAPYSAPAAYYFPPVARMQGVEVTKGPGQIKYGPYTTGGSLNLLSTEIPEEASGKVNLGVGTNNLKKAYANIGNSWKHGGVMFETYQLDTDTFKDLDYGKTPGIRVEDYQLKFRLNTDRESDFYQELEYKIGFYDQLSDETYLGLTDEDFARKSNRRYAASQLDNIDADHVQHNLRHYAELGEGVDLTTTLYHNETQRNWQKVESVNGTSNSIILSTPQNFADEMAWIRGETSPDGVFRYRQNKRDYESMGIQSTLGVDFELGPTEHQLEVSARFHRDEEDRFQREDRYSMNNGSMVLAERGAEGSNANRIGSANAWAFYAQDRIQFDQFTFIPGIRYERINYTRKDYGRNDPTRSGEELRRSDTSVDSIIPGIGVQYDINQELAVFAGVHKGFSPPGPASSSGPKEEKSVNYELGGRYRKNSFSSDLIFFISDYDSLLGVDSASSGGTGSGDLFNAGKVDVYGLEFALGYDLVETLEMSFAIPLKLAYTHTDAEFKSSFESDFFGSVTKGDEIPYIAQNQLYTSLGFEYDVFGVYFDGYYSDSMKTVAGEVGFPDQTDSHMVFDVLTKWQYTDNVRFFANVENLFDREYVVARRPAGARPGLPLTAIAGLEVTF